MNTPPNVLEEARYQQRIELTQNAHQRTQHAFLQAFNPLPKPSSEQSKENTLPTKKLKNESVPTLNKLIFSAIMMHPKLIIMILSVFFAMALLSVFNPILIGCLITEVVKMGNRTNITFIGCILLGIGASIGLFSLIKITLFARMEISFIYHFQSGIMKRLLQLPLAFFDQYSTGELCHRILMVESLAKMVGPNQMGLFLSFIFSFINIIVMAYYSWQLTLSTLVFIGIFSVISLWSNRHQMPYIEQYIEHLSHTYGFALQVIHGISRIKLFSKEADVEALWAEKYMFARRSLFSAYRIGVWRYTLCHHIQSISLLILFVVSAQLQRSQLPLSTFVVFFSAFTQFMIGFTIFSLQAQGLAPIITAYQRLKPLFTEEIETSDRPTHFTLGGRLSLQNITFSYPSSEQVIFDALNASIDSGEHVAFVGLSGSGKSTLFKLLLGFYTPQKGQIQYDGIPMSELNLLTLRQQIGVVFQDGKLVTASILENLVGHTDATEEEAWRVIKLVGLEDYILSLPMRLNTIVSQHLNVLSGGQKQLLLIAKALVGRPSLLLLDEATNALDNHAQNIVIQRINQLKMTRISIAHRLSTVLYADKIMVLSQGKIVECGTYTQLLQERGLFYDLVEQQQGITQLDKDTAS